MTLNDIELGDERCREAFAVLIDQHNQAGERWQYVVTPAFVSENYIVSDLGRVISLPRYRYYDRNTRSEVRHRKFQPGGLMRPGIQPSGYRTITIIHNKEPYRTHVHRLVAWAFLGVQPQEMSVIHLDGNPANQPPHQSFLPLYPAHKQRRCVPAKSNRYAYRNQCIARPGHQRRPRWTCCPVDGVACYPGINRTKRKVTSTNQTLVNQHVQPVTHQTATHGS